MCWDVVRPSEAVAISCQLCHMYQGKTFLRDEEEFGWPRPVVPQSAHRTDMRAVVVEAGRRNGADLAPVAAYRLPDFRSMLVAERGRDTVSAGL
jgi:hypothetical protein